MWNNERDLMCSLLEYLRQFIESEEREDIFNAFEQILNETGLSDFKEKIMQLIDEKRSW